MVEGIFCLTATILFYYLAKKINRKKPGILFSPVILTPVFLIVLLLITNIPYARYSAGNAPVNYMLNVVTVALAIPLYKNWSFLVSKWKVILASLTAGSLIAVVTGIFSAYWIALSEAQIISMIPRIATIPIATVLSEAIGGIPTVTVLFSMLTCFIAVFLAPTLLKTLNIKNPLTVGLMYGIGGQAMGTAKAFEKGEAEGTAASVSYILTALLTVVWAIIFAPVVSMLIH